MHITTAIKLSQRQPAHVYWLLYISKPDKAEEEVWSALVEKPSSAGQNSPFQVTVILMNIRDDQKVWCKVKRAEHKTLYAV